MADKALQVIGQRDVFLVDEGDVPVRMLVKGDAMQGRVAHVVEDEVHRGGVAFVFLAEFVAETEAARGQLPATEVASLRESFDTSICLDRPGLLYSQSCEVQQRSGNYQSH